MAKRFGRSAPVIQLSKAAPPVDVSKIEGVLPVEKGGTNAVTDADAIVELGAAEADHAHSEADLTRVFTVTTTHLQVTTAMSVVLADATSGVITATLPTAASATGRIITVKKTDSSGNAVTVESSDTIDGVTTKLLTTVGQAIRVGCHNSKWWVI